MPIKRSVDKTRASRDGHEYHENWAARKALQLLWPKDGLIGVTLEGLHPVDQRKSIREAAEIADVTLYYGKDLSFEKSTKVSIVQLKYSISDAEKPFRASNAKKTVKKFAKTYLDCLKKYGPSISAKLDFQLITNRPIFSDFHAAIEGLKNDKNLNDNIKKQATQFVKATGLKDQQLKDFSNRISIVGLTGNLTENKKLLKSTLADWSTARDPVSKAQLEGLKQVIRDKAGSIGENRNIITRVDVLAALEVTEEDLFPCPNAFSTTDKILDRAQLPEITAQLENIDQPIVIHAGGGVGKTVFLQSLAKTCENKGEVILFDCFGGGSYRAPDDARHLPRKAFAQIINSLTSRGLCDPLIISGNDNTEDIIRKVRSRLSQSVEALRRINSKYNLYIFLDAIDNAIEFADEKGQPCFSNELFRSIEYNGAITGLKLIVSCRTERKAKAIKDFNCFEYELKPFTLNETSSFIRARIKNATETEIQVAYARSGGNGRVLEYLVNSDRGLLDKSEIKNELKLDDLLKEFILKALQEAKRQGYSEENINSFLAGLSVLPPPVPIDEYARAQNISVSAVESFISDLIPLLEKTKNGVWFRDEPTETFIRERYAHSEAALKTVAQNLLKDQDKSVYAARALPSLLRKLNDENSLFLLAFDTRFPKTISRIGKDAIRQARLKAATLYAADTKNFNNLTELLVELSTVAAINNRGASYICDNPDLIIASEDKEATRRLFELRTAWQGTRHARLAIANIISGDLSEAYRHGVSASEWIENSLQSVDKKGFREKTFEALDIASIPLCLLAQNKPKKANQWMKRWKSWYSFDVARWLLSFIETANLLNGHTQIDINLFLKDLSGEIGVIAAALSFLELSSEQRELLITKLANASKNATKIEMPDRLSRRSDCSIEDGILKASALAIMSGKLKEGKTILELLEIKRPSLWSYTEHFAHYSLIPFLIGTALSCAASKNELKPLMLLPKDLLDIWPDADPSIKLDQLASGLKTKMKTALQNYNAGEKKNVNEPSISYETEREADKFLSGRFPQILKLAEILVSVFSSKVAPENEFEQLIASWEEIFNTNNEYHYNQNKIMFFDLFGKEILFNILWMRPDLPIKSLKKLWDSLNARPHISASYIIKIIEVISKRPDLHSLVSDISAKATSLIENEDDVGQRASYYADLSRAMLFASLDDAAIYFRNGLDQMSAIGSGDYAFVNELLLFASNIRGPELADEQFHTLNNICELNLGDEVEKFYWYAFAKALSKTSGIKSLARIARWDDRNRVCLEYTLMPYLIALIEDQKIDPKIALALLRLTETSEPWNCTYATLAKALYKNNYPNHQEVFSEFFAQFDENNHELSMDETLSTLHEIANEIFGKFDDITQRLYEQKVKYKTIREIRNVNLNYSGDRDVTDKEARLLKEKEDEKNIIKLADNTDVLSNNSIGDAISKMEGYEFFNLRPIFFDKLRQKVSLSNQSKYLRTIAELENFDLYPKLNELKTCKVLWKNSPSTNETLKDLASQIIRIHADDFISHSSFSGYLLKDIYELCDISMTDLALEFVKIYASLSNNLPSTIWMSLACFIIKNSQEGSGQAALIRLLTSEAAALASKVTDGTWTKDMYPAPELETVASGLIWLKLGSPLAADRWRAAHTIRRLAKLGQWKTLELLISKFDETNANPFQAPETEFYYLHARLWLLIALARVAIDYPHEIAAWEGKFLEIALDKGFPHVLIKHFACEILLTCIAKNVSKLKSTDIDAIKAINKPKEIKSGSIKYNKRYEKRPDEAKNDDRFRLDYDFEKYDVTSLCDMFGVSGWEVSDRISDWVRKFDAEIESMHQSDKRERPGRFSRENSSKYHSYGYYLGWHAKYLTAGDLVQSFPVLASRDYEPDPWGSWIKDRSLTRADGLWLSDGIDKFPCDSNIHLLVKGDKQLVLTSDKELLLQLVGLNEKETKDLVAYADWSSIDGIKVSISSCLVAAGSGAKNAYKLAKQPAFEAWLPRFNLSSAGEQYIHSKKSDYIPFLVLPEVEARIDSTDTLGHRCAMERAHIDKKLSKAFKITSSDPFQSKWKDASGNIVMRSQAWGYTAELHEDRSKGSSRFYITKDFLAKLLTETETELIIFIKLEKYQETTYNSSSQYHHTTAAISLDANGTVKFFMGHANELHKSQY